MEKRIEDLNLEDDFLFSRVMSDEEICRIVLEKLLNISIKKIVLPEQQKTIDLLLDSKGVRLDIYVNDDVGTIYNCEMQRGKRGQLPKRSRRSLKPRAVPQPQPLLPGKYRPGFDF